MKPFETLQSVEPRDVRVALAECADRVEKGLVMRPNHVRPLIKAVEEQARIIEKFQRTARQRQLSYDAVMALRTSQDKGEPTNG